MLGAVGVVDGGDWVKARTRHLQAELEKAASGAGSPRPEGRVYTNKPGEPG